MMITKEHIEAELNKLHTANNMTPNPLLNSDLGLAIINDLLKQVKNIAYEPVLCVVCPNCGCNKMQDDGGNYYTCLNVLCDFHGQITL